MGEETAPLRSRLFTHPVRGSEEYHPALRSVRSRKRAICCRL